MNAIPPRFIVTGTILLGLAAAAFAGDLTYVNFESHFNDQESYAAESEEIAPAEFNWPASGGDGIAVYEPSCSDHEYCPTCCPCGNYCGSSNGGCYAEVQFNFFRAHVPEGAIITFSKLSEEYELSPRFLVGYENSCGDGVRARYWHHGHQHDNIAGPSGIRFEWDVFDLEYTKRLSRGRHDVTLAAGVRLADTNIRYTIWDAHSSLIGGTIAADVRSIICCRPASEVAFVYGGRLALLGGDIDGGTQGLVRDLNWRVWELYAGPEFRCCRGGIDIYSQLAFEIQNWLPDEMIGELTALDSVSIGFVGPSFRFGVVF